MKLEKTNNSKLRQETLFKYTVLNNSYPHLLSPEHQAHIHSSLRDQFGRVRTNSLFWEYRHSEREDMLPLFTTKDKPHTVKSDFSSELITYPSLKQIYFTYDHIPNMEYDFAMEVFGSWEVWERITKCVIKDLIQDWRDEYEIKLKADAIRKMIQLSKQDSAAGATATRYLADKGYLDKKVGRISKADKEREIKIAAGLHDDLSSDMERLGLSIVNGGR